MESLHSANVRGKYTKSAFAMSIVESNEIQDPFRGRIGSKNYKIATPPLLGTSLSRVKKKTKKSIKLKKLEKLEKNELK